MPLQRKMIFATLLLFSMLLGLFYVVEFNQTREYLDRQLRLDLENGAQALALSLPVHLQRGDRLGADKAIDALSAAGRFQLIRFESADAGLVLVRELPADQGQAPRWFKNLQLFATAERRQTLHGPRGMLGELHLVADPGFAYAQLWTLSIQSAAWFGVVALLVMLLLLLTVRRLFQPLVAIEARANEIAEQRFGHPLPEPELVELKSLVHSFNAMSQRLHTLFNRQAEETETLRRAAYQDRLSGLGNRAFFDAELDHWMSEPGEGGLLFLQLSHLERLYREQGYEARDQLIVAVAEQLRGFYRADPRWVLARTSDAEFGLLLPGCDASQLEAALKELDQRLIAVTHEQTERFGRLHAIGASLRVAGMSRGELLACADAALQQVHHDNSHSYRLQSAEEVHAALGRNFWRQLVQTAMVQERVDFQLQPVMDMKGKITGLELFSAIRNEGVTYPAAQFMPFVEQYQLGGSYDRYVLEAVAPHIAAHRVPVVVNLSESAIGDVAFVNWLGSWLESDVRLRHRLGFELPEVALVKHPDALISLAALFRQLDVRFGFDRIGRHLEQLKALVELGPGYLKVDRSLVLCPSEEDRGFLKALARLAHDQDVDLIALRIEDEVQLARLAETPVDGYQGYIRAPVSWALGRLAS